jgi:hypothetical protein
MPGSNSAQDIRAQPAVGLVRDARLLGSGVHAGVGSGKVHSIHHIRRSSCQRMVWFQQEFISGLSSSIISLYGRYSIISYEIDFLG